MSLVSMLKPNGRSGFGYGTTAEQVTEGLNLAGKTYLVTGCNSGLGAEAVRVLAKRGATVVGTARTVDKAKAALSGLQGAVPVACELSEPASVRAAVAEVKKQGLKLDGLIANAGIMALPTLQVSHGVELQFLTNHIGHFMLVTGLLGQLTEAGRVVMLSSAAHLRAPKGGISFDNLDGSKGYSSWAFYGQSKFANLLFAKELAKRLPGKQTANAVHPGVIQTNLGRHMNAVMRAALGLSSSLFLKSVPEGAATEVYVATHPSLAGVSGEYFADCNVSAPRGDALEAGTAKRLWEVTEEIVAKLP